jgi:hypothetical protein
MSAEEEEPTFSLVEGGPAHRFFRAIGLRRGDESDGSRLATAFVFVVWGPLIVCGIVAGLFRGRMPSILLDYSVHARLLVAAPLFLIGEPAMGMFTRRCIDRFVAGRWNEEGLAPVARILAKATRLRDAAAPEMVLLGLAIAGAQAVFWGASEALGWERGRRVETHAQAASLWYAFVALPAFQFLVGRWMWRWAIWIQVLWRLSRLQLRPMAIHPDRQGGLGFLSEPSVGLGYVIFGVSAVQAGIWANKVSMTDVPLASFKALLAVLIVVMLIGSLGPLFCFSGQLWRARFIAVRQYDAFAHDYTRLFHRHWIEEGNREGLLGTPDLQSLADLGSAYEGLQRMRLVPFGVRPIVILVLTVVVPMIPVILMRVPVLDLLEKVGALVAGGGPA